MTNLGHRVTTRSKELTHAAHAKGLIDHTDSLKRTTPILVSAIKIFVTTSQKGGNMSSTHIDRQIHVTTWQKGGNMYLPIYVC